MELYLVCFDISDDRDRYRLGKRLLRHGNRVQESVFEIMIKSKQEKETLRKELSKYVDDGDDLRFYCLCRGCRKRSMDHTGEVIAEYPGSIVI